MSLLLMLGRWLITAAVVALAAWATPGVSLERGIGTALWVALLIALANVAIQQGLRLLPRPRSTILLAVLTLTVNGLAIWAISSLTRVLDVEGLIAAVEFALMITIFSVALATVLDRLSPSATPPINRTTGT